MADFIEQISSPRLHLLLLPFKVLSVLFSIGTVGFLVFVYHERRWMRSSLRKNWGEFTKMRPYEILEFDKKWAKTKQRLEKGWESEAKLAIIEADKFLNEFLKRMGYAGESLGERLKQVKKDVLPNVDDVWQAHKIRNDIVHDPDYRFSNRAARVALESYEKAFNYLREV